MKSSVIGVDIGKHELVIYWNNQFMVIMNNKKDIDKWLGKHRNDVEKVDLIVYEPTGGYERNLHEALETYKLPYRRVHANHVRAFAKATGVSAKTDKLDAKLLAEFATRMELSPKPIVTVAPELKALLTRREQLLEMQLQERNRLESSEPLLSKWIEESIKQLSKQLKELEKELNRLIRLTPKIKELLELYTSIPAIGKITALQLIVDLPELLEENEKVLAALVGLAPWNRDSGTRTGRRRTRGGRKRVRGLLYMASVVAIRCNSNMKAFYTKLKQKGKATKVALIAVAHKLLGILRSVAQRRTAWVPVISI